MSRDALLYLEDVIEACRRIQTYIIGMSREAFEADERTYDAVVRNLEVAGEAAKHIPAEVRERITSIDWRRLAGLRDVLAHAYFGIDNDILWDVVTNKVPTVAAVLAAELATDSDLTHTLNR